MKQAAATKQKACTDDCLPASALDEVAAVAALSALGQRSRLQVFRLLVEAGPEGMSAGDIAKAVGAPANTMSTHLAILTRSGLIQFRREARNIVYGLDVDGVRELFAFLLSDCCGGHPELCAPFLGAAACQPATPRKSRA